MGPLAAKVRNPWNVQLECRIPVPVHSIRPARPWRRAAWQLARAASFEKKCKRHAITGKRSLNWSPAVRTNREQFLDKKGNPGYDCKNVGRAVPRRGGGLERRGDGTERKLPSAALNALTTFPRGQSARVPARPARKPRRRRMFSACRPRAVRLQGRVAVATDPPGAATAFTQVIEPAGGRRAPPSPRSGEGVAEGDGWGVESRALGPQVRGNVRASRLASQRRATPHPALRATFPSKLGKGSPRDLRCVNTVGGATGRSESDPRRTGRMQVARKPVTAKGRLWVSGVRPDRRSDGIGQRQHQCSMMIVDHPRPTYARYGSGREEGQ